MRKKQWQKPELAVLERSKPEEAVLLACKTTGKSSGKSTSHSGCYYNANCSTCNNVAAS